MVLYDRNGLVSHTEFENQLSPLKGVWPENYCIDPVTTLIGFPDFHRSFPKLFQMHLATKGGVGIAIGDVDHLKHYVESTKATQPWMFGHLAGNALMSKLGFLALQWLHEWYAPWAVLSSFGGDEVILVATGLNRREFASAVRSLSRLLSEELPCTVSFAYGWFVQAETLSLEQSIFPQHYVNALVLIDRALFQAKAERTNSNHSNYAGPRILGLVTRKLTANGWITCHNKH